MNMSSAVRIPLPPQLSPSPAAATVSAPIRVPPVQQPALGKYIVTKPPPNMISQKDVIRVPPFTGNATPVTKIASVQSTSAPVTKPYLNQLSLESPSNKNEKGYMVVNARNVPGSVKSSVVMPSLHHVQIASNVEGKSVMPTSSLPPTLHKKILTAAAGPSEVNSPSKTSPAVIYMSPVSSLKAAPVKHLSAVPPKMVPEIPAPILQTAASPGVLNSSSVIHVVPSAGPSGMNDQQVQDAPMKWVVQENPQSASPCLVPMVSSSSTPTNVLKNFSEMKYSDSGPTNRMPLIANSSSVLTGSQLAQLKDNALVMYNGKVYVLAKRGSEVAAMQGGSQISPFTVAGRTTNEAQQRNESINILQTSTGNQISNKVVNLVLSKSKSQNFIQKDSISKKNDDVSDFVLRNIKIEPAEVCSSENERFHTDVPKPVETISVVQSMNIENLQRERFMRTIPPEKESQHIISTVPAEITATRQNVYIENLQRDHFSKMPSENEGPQRNNTKTAETPALTVQSMISDKGQSRTESAKPAETANTTVQNVSGENLPYDTSLRNKGIGFQGSPAPQKETQQEPMAVQTLQKKTQERRQNVKKSLRDLRCETRKAKKHLSEAGQKMSLSDSELKKMYGIHSDIKICLKRIVVSSSSALVKDSSASILSSNQESDTEVICITGLPSAGRRPANSKTQQLLINLEWDSPKRRASPGAVSSATPKKKKSESDSEPAAEPLYDASRRHSVQVPSPKPLFSKQKSSLNSEGSVLEGGSADDSPNAECFTEESSYSKSTDPTNEELDSSDKLILESPADPDEIVRDEKIRRLKELLRQREAALEEIRKKMQNT
ncbi:ligand-dependent nuclear receptor-interacting factor 1-like isoform X2 [Protopterus annectens]|nr:ligand-dependent nuclear receptor-interacting factor 1-like isoform X2 [Protopterus annectens]XP_043932572.1 ligand-dependent nuclear receptor-interacting factor 1-like isoform X2 [Protopterus annectens]